MVFVLSKSKKPLEPKSFAEVRKLLKKGKAVIHKKYPFTIRLKYEVKSTQCKGYVLKFDPGSKTTGIAIVEDKPKNAKVIFLANLSHKQTIKFRMDARRAFRRARRNRKTRYRKPRFLNRTRVQGWLPPSIQSIVDNIEHWTKKLKGFCPISKIVVETVRFDTQLMENPDIQGEEYQQGTLWGYEVREYLIHKYGHNCQYCKVQSKETKQMENMSKDDILEAEHMTSKANGGSNRVKNLTVACKTCNSDKGKLNLDQWLEVLKKGRKTKLNKARIENIEKIIKNGLPAIFKDAARVNSSRKKVYRVLSQHIDNLEVSSGGRTKFNRTQRKLPKTHYFDALCVGKNAPKNFAHPKGLKVLNIKAAGRGSRSRTNLDKNGFPKAYLPRQKAFFGFQTGDIVKAIVPKGKNKGSWIGKVAVRKTGSFKVILANGDKKDGINQKYCKVLQRGDGYVYGLENISCL